MLLIEAGPDEPTGAQVVGFGYKYLNTSIDWKYKAYPQDGSSKEVLMPRGKVLGGTSVLNGMMYMRGTKDDYNRWAELGNKEWNYNNVLKFFKKSENNLNFENKYHAQGGYQDVGRCPYTHPMVPDFIEAASQNGL